MKLPGYRILREIVKRRELTLGEVCELLPRPYQDQRDFYALASLYTAGLIDSSIKRDGCNWDTSKNSLVAEEFFTLSLGKGTFQVGEIPEFTNDEDYLKTFKFFCTGKADMYFQEQHQKRTERIAALVVGITVGIVSAFFGAYFRDILTSDRGASCSCVRDAQPSLRGDHLPAQPAGSSAPKAPSGPSSGTLDVTGSER